MATTKAKAGTNAKKKPRPRLPVPAAVCGLLSAQQVCDALGGGSLRKLRGMISAGQFPRADAKFGQFPRWSVALVNRWVAGECRPDGTPLDGEG